MYIIYNFCGSHIFLCFQCEEGEGKKLALTPSCSSLSLFTLDTAAPVFGDHVGSRVFVRLPHV